MRKELFKTCVTEVHMNRICLLIKIVFDHKQVLFLKVPYRCLRILDLICHHHSYACLMAGYICLYF
jgi:hypothetical protein